MGLFRKKKEPFKEITSVPLVEEPVTIKEAIEATHKPSNLPNLTEEEDMGELSERVTALEEWCKKFKDYVDGKLK